MHAAVRECFRAGFMPLPIHKLYPGFDGAELLPYHRLGAQKINRFGLAGEAPHADFETPSRETEQKWIDAVRAFGGRLVNEDAV